MTDKPESFEMQADYAVYCPVGEYSFGTIVDMIDRALGYCRDNDIERLLVNVTGATGIGPLSTAQRFQFATQWAGTAARHVTLAIVAPPELIDDDRIGVTMANNRGLLSEVFTTEAAAASWLTDIVPDEGAYRSGSRPAGS